jgi:hypothetical protein
MKYFQMKWAKIYNDSKICVKAAIVFLRLQMRMWAF